VTENPKARYGRHGVRLRRPPAQFKEAYARNVREPRKKRGDGPNFSKVPAQDQEGANAVGGPPAATRGVPVAVTAAALRVSKPSRPSANKMRGPSSATPQLIRLNQGEQRDEW